MVPKTAHLIQGEATPKAKQRRTVSVLAWLVMLCLMPPQDTPGPPGYQDTLMAQAQLAIDRDPQVPFHSAALQLLISQSRHTTRVAWSYVHNLALAHVELQVELFLVIAHLSNLSRSLQDLSTLKEINKSS